MTMSSILNRLGGTKSAAAAIAAKAPAPAAEPKKKSVKEVVWK